VERPRRPSRLPHAPAAASRTRAEWTLAAVEKYLTAKRRRESTALHLLTGLARQMGVTYSKAVHTPVIAQHLRQAVVDQLKPVVSRIAGA
jgi:hypothetical protein